MTTEPLVWLPFPPDELGDLPAGLRYEHFDADGDLPESAAEVELYVLPYRFRAGRRRGAGPAAEAEGRSRRCRPASSTSPPTCPTE